MGAIIFENNRDSLFSKIINLQTYVESGFKRHGTIGHVAICLGEFNGNTLILEADGSEVDINFLDKFKPHNHYLEAFNVYPKVPQHVVKNALLSVTDKYMLQKYGKGQIVGFALELLFGLKKNPLSKGVICSELGAYFMDELGLGASKALNQDVNLVTPTDLYDLCLKVFTKPSFVKPYDTDNFKVVR